LDWHPDETLLLDLVADEFWRGVWATVDRLQDLLVTPEEFGNGALARAAQRRDELHARLAGAIAPRERDRATQDLADYAALPGLARVVEVLYYAYQEELRRRGALDFPGQIMAAYRLLAENPDVQARYRAQFRHILVDEVQDTSGAQMKVVAALAAPGLCNVTVIGDQKQSIYGWRGARPENLAQIQPVGLGGAEIGLQANYRSYQEILDVARHALVPLVAAGRVRQDELDLVAHNGAAGGQIVTLAGPADEVLVGEGRRLEAQYVAAQVAALLAPAIDTAARRYHGEDIVILMRSVASAGIYEEALRARGIPTLVIGAGGFFSRPELRDALALLRVAVDPLDDAALVRVM